MYGRLSPEVAQRLDDAGPLLVAFGILNAGVALLVNPWRDDRIPDRFPTIVQDAIVMVLFAVAATLILQERIFATTAVGAVVIGFALQDTLGNLFAGLAIQIEKPFRVGHWVTIAGRDGIVTAITWRATKIRTKTGDLVIVPNNMLSRDMITNYSEPTVDTLVEVEVGAGYETPPNEVKAAILDAIADMRLLSPGRAPEVLIADFAASAVTYRIRVWTPEFARDSYLRDEVRSLVYYAFRRHGISIPYPMQVQIEQQAAPLVRDTDGIAAALARVDIFRPLSDAQRDELAGVAQPCLYAKGERIVRQEAAGTSMFVVAGGEVSVTLNEAAGEVARLRAGAFFGEMSMLTGEARTANVIAVTDCNLLEITADAMRQLVLKDPSIVEQVAAAVAVRREELERHRATGAGASPAVEQAQSLIARVWRYFNLSPDAR